MEDLQPKTFQEGWQDQGLHLAATLGVADLPHQQRQETILHDFSKDGNLALFSQPTMGKSSFLQTVVMDLARRNRPDQVHFYLFDFGTTGLLPLSKLPHVADYLTIEDDEKLLKFITRIKAELERRKKLFSRYTVSSLTLYRELSGDPLPQLMLVFDSFDGIKDVKAGEALEVILQVLARDGESLGISILLTASRTNALKPAFYTNIKKRVVFKLADTNEHKLIVGRTDLIMVDIAGRGLIMLDQPEVFQTALPARGEDTMAVIRQLQDEVGRMEQAWTGQRPKTIPVVPTELSFDRFAQWETVEQAVAAKALPLGLDVQQVEAVSLPLERFRHLLYVSDDPDHLRHISHHLIKTTSRLTQGYRVMLMDVDGEFGEYGAELFARVTKTETFETMGSQLLALLEERQASQEDKVPLLIIIPDLERFEQASDLTGEQIVRLYQEGWKVGLYFLVGGLHQYLNNNSSTSLPKQLRDYNQTYAFGMRLTDQNLVDKAYNTKEAYPNPDELHLYNRKGSVKLKISLEKELHQ